MPNDRELTCRDCAAAFVFTGGEQEFYSSKGLQHDPVRCPSCRASRKAMRPEDREITPTYGTYASWGGRTPRQLNVATCAKCQQTTEVPFLPRGDRPVYCSSCYSGVREQQEHEEEAATARLAAAIAGGGQSERPEGGGPAGEGSTDELQAESTSPPSL